MGAKSNNILLAFLAPSDINMLTELEFLNHYFCKKNCIHNELFSTSQY